MPLRHHDPFTDRSAGLDVRHNPFVARMRAALETKTLPVTSGEGLREYPGAWRQRIRGFYNAESTYDRLILEIGCHLGHTLTAMAQENPDTGFAGLDITYKRVVTAAEKTMKLGLRNVITAMANATALDQIFAPGELSGVVIFFPDPWTRKKRQQKNRLLTGEFAQSLRQAIQPGGFLWFKTDQQPYFDAASEAFVEAGFTADHDNLPLGRDYTSLFEQRFHEQNLPTFTGKWLRSAESPANQI